MNGAWQCHASMNAEKLQELKSMVEGAGNLPEEARAELLKLVAKAQEEAADESGEPTDYVSKLMSSVVEMEASHPDATAFINKVATALGNMGI